MRFVMGTNRKSTRRGILRLLLVVSLLNLTTGCFVPQPVDEWPGPAADVQLRLSDEAAERISRQAQQPVEGVAGQVVRITPDSVIVAVRWGQIAGGSSGRPGPDVVRLARSEVEEVATPRFSLTRTLLLAGALTLAGIAIATGLFGIAAGNPGEDDGEGPGPNPN